MGGSASICISRKRGHLEQGELVLALIGDLAPMYAGLKEIEALVPEEIRLTRHLFENVTSVHFKVIDF